LLEELNVGDLPEALKPTANQTDTALLVLSVKVPPQVESTEARKWPDAWVPKLPVSVVAKLSTSILAQEKSGSQVPGAKGGLVTIKKLASKNFKGIFGKKDEPEVTTNPSTEPEVTTTNPDTKQTANTDLNQDTNQA
jgi:hypothetical protein